MKKVVSIVGARPQFVKAAVLSRVFLKYKKIQEVLMHTGQHFDTEMSDVFFYEMELPKPQYNLNINRLGHGAMTGQMLEKIEQVLLKESPDAVLVYGDTNSTLAGALAARKLQIKVIHVEAGLRSFNMDMPEEVNRILTDRISDLLLCPTNRAILNLQAEGFENLPIQIQKCGDIMKDAVAYYGGLSDQKSSIINSLGLEPDGFVLATVHRQENTNNIDRLKAIFEALTEIHQFKKVILPLHPRTKSILEKNNLTYPITFISPVGYLDMLALLKNCNLVVSDSGGLQKEAFFNKKHCIIVREETEWVELVENGFASIVGTDKKAIKSAFKNYQTFEADFSMSLYGNKVGECMHTSILDLLTDHS